jgi:hypothetical protein
MVDLPYHEKPDECVNISDLKKWACNLAFQGTLNDTFQIVYETKLDLLHHPSSDAPAILLDSLPLYS